MKNVNVLKDWLIILTTNMEKKFANENSGSLMKIMNLMNGGINFVQRDDEVSLQKEQP